MKNIILKTLNGILILLFALFLLTACGKKDETGAKGSTASGKNYYYTCTMHPQVISDKPGVCPICNMELVKKYITDTTGQKAGTDTIQAVTLGGNKQVLANVSIYKVKKENLYKEFTAYSYLDFAEQNRRTIAARFNGRIEKMFADRTGDVIKIGEPLFEIYSPDLVQAQNEFLIALNGSGGNRTSLVDAARKKLELYGLTQEQIKHLENSKEVKMTLTYYSPFNGTVLEKKSQEGMYVNEGNSIYEIADLSGLWNIAEINENDIKFIKPGSSFKLHLQAYPGEEFNGKVTFIYPLVNEQTRTLKIRSEISSLGGKLKPQMYGESVFNNSKGMGLTVPADAVIFTGHRNVVWVNKGKGVFEARDVKLGDRFDNKYEILSGLKEGDEVAATGGFLIDSESQLREGMSSGHNNGGSMPGMNMPKDNSAPMKNMQGSKSASAGNSIVRSGIIDLAAIDANKDGKVYQDFMDWNVISDKPGVCPLCGMTLKQVSLDEAKNNLIKNGFKVK